MNIMAKTTKTSGKGGSKPPKSGTSGGKPKGGGKGC
jgi:hypothetical protein